LRGFLWTCAPLLIKSADVVNAWKFRYITKAFCWLKTYPNGGFVLNVGSHIRANTEDVWLLSNGTPKRKNADICQVVPTVERDEAIMAPVGRHSAKPEEMYRRVERYIDGPYLEVFARRQRPGWTCLGNEIDGLDIRDALQRLADAPSAPERQMAHVDQPMLF